MSVQGVVYTITNKVTGKVYIGETKRGAVRLYERRKGLETSRERNTDLQNDYDEYGVGNFNFENIMETENHKFCEFVLIELFSRVKLGYKQRRGDQIQKVTKGDLMIPQRVFNEVEKYVHKCYKGSSFYQHMLVEIQDMKGGFECKSEDIYNRDFKTEFCKLNYSVSTQRPIEALFRRTCDFELKWEKDLYDFTFDEIEVVLYSLEVTTIRSLQNITSKLKKYKDFAIKQAVSNDKLNYFNGLGKQVNGSKYLLGVK